MLFHCRPLLLGSLYAKGNFDKQQVTTVIQSFFQQMQRMRKQNQRDSGNETNHSQHLFLIFVTTSFMLPYFPPHIKYTITKNFINIHIKKTWAACKCSRWYVNPASGCFCHGPLCGQWRACGTPKQKNLKRRVTQATLNYRRLTTSKSFCSN